MTLTPQQPHGALRSYGRVKARVLKARQAALLDTVAPEVDIPDGPFDPRDLKPDAREVAGRLPDGCLDRIFILFPDPWPKSRHHKRRIIQSEFLVELHRLLKPGGRLRFATDWAAYADWTLQRMQAGGLFTGPIGDTAVPPADHLTTRYEEKKLGDCAPVFLDFERV